MMCNLQCELMVEESGSMWSGYLLRRSAMVRLCDDPAGRYHVKHMDRILAAGTGEYSSILCYLPYLTDGTR